MSENLPYHDEQWDDLPLPNEAEAWQKMQRLLEEKDRRRRLLPFWFWRYGLLGILLAGLATGGYFLLGKDSVTSKEAIGENASVPTHGKSRQKPREQVPEKTEVSSQPDKSTTTASKPSDEKPDQSLVINRGNAGFEKQPLQKS